MQPCMHALHSSLLIFHDKSYFLRPVFFSSNNIIEIIPISVLLRTSSLIFFSSLMDAGKSQPIIFHSQCSQLHEAAYYAFLRET